MWSTTPSMFREQHGDRNRDPRRLLPSYKLSSGITYCTNLTALLPTKLNERKQNKNHTKTTACTYNRADAFWTHIHILIFDFLSKLEIKTKVIPMKRQWDGGLQYPETLYHKVSILYTTCWYFPARLLCYFYFTLHELDIIG